MYGRELDIMKQKVEKLAKKAGFREVPTLRISKNEHLIADASILRKRITIGAKLLSQWQKGEINDTDVEVTLAHEIGHLMDFERKFRSVFFQHNAVVMVYFILGVVLPKLVSSMPVAEPWMPPLSVFILWAIFLPWILRRAAFTVQLKADKNASRLINDQQLANSFVKRPPFYRPKGIGIVTTWKLLLNVILYPSLSERLENLNYEIKEHKIDIQKL